MEGITDLKFTEFLQAAKQSQSPEDVIDDLGRFIERSCQLLERALEVRKEMEVFRGDILGEVTLSLKSEISERKVVERVWACVVESFESHCVLSVGLKLDVARFLSETLNFPRHSPREIAELRMWNSERVRDAFNARFGDLREASIREHEASALARITDASKRILLSDSAQSDKPPVIQISGPIHRVDFSGRMSYSFHRLSIDEFCATLRYLIHLATGASPGDITIPEFCGYSNDYMCQWERSDVLKRQTSPFPGAVWLRFTAAGVVDIQLAPQVFALLAAKLKDASCNIN